MKVYLGEAGENRLHELRSALEYVGLFKELSQPSKIFVKPNFTFPRHIAGVTTTPEFVEDVLNILSDSGAEVFVGESNGGYGSFLASEAFRGHNLAEMCKRTKTTIVDLSELESKSYTEVIAGRPTTVRLPRFLVEDIDFTVSLPVLKVHSMTTVSLSVKNLWGCYPTDLRLLEHAELAHKLALIHRLVRARFGVIDAVFGLDNHGPMQGTARYLGKLIAGNDLYCLDWISSRMMGFDPRTIMHLKLIPAKSKAEVADGRIESNFNWKQVNWHFTLKRDFVDALSVACFHSDILAKIVFDSPFTRAIYAILGRTPRKRLA